jgi:hypothetical protein
VLLPNPNMRIDVVRFSQTRIGDCKQAFRLKTPVWQG